MQDQPPWLRYAWIDLSFFILTIVLLIPLAFHLAEIVIDFLASLPG